MKSFLIVILVGLGLASCLHMTGCTSANARSAKFAADMEVCHQTSRTCQEFVDCQRRAQAAANQVPTGKCR